MNGEVVLDRIKTLNPFAKKTKKVKQDDVLHPGGATCDLPVKDAAQQYADQGIKEQEALRQLEQEGKKGSLLATQIYKLIYYCKREIGVLQICIDSNSWKKIFLTGLIASLPVLNEAATAFLDAIIPADNPIVEDREIDYHFHNLSCAVDKPKIITWAGAMITAMTTALVAAQGLLDFGSRAAAAREKQQGYVKALNGLLECTFLGEEAMEIQLQKAIVQLESTKESPFTPSGKDYAKYDDNNFHYIIPMTGEDAVAFAKVIPKVKEEKTKGKAAKCVGLEQGVHMHVTMDACSKHECLDPQAENSAPGISNVKKKTGVSFACHPHGCLEVEPNSRVSVEHGDQDALHLTIFQDVCEEDGGNANVHVVHGDGDDDPPLVMTITML